MCKYFTGIMVMYKKLFIKEFVDFALGNKKRVEYINRLTKKRPDLSKEEINRIISLIDKFDNQRKEMAAVYWIGNGRLILPEDMGKLDDAVELMDRFGLDYTKFDGPVELINSIPKEKRARVVTGSGDPDNYKELRLDYKAETEFGELKVYFVKDDRDGQMAVREIMNTQMGRDWKGPWCLLRGDGVGGIDKDAFKYWSKWYGKTPKRVAFLNGDIIAFCASGRKMSVLWWDMDDRSWESMVPLKVETESVVREVGDFLEREGREVVREWVALEDAGIDDINNMEVGYVEKKTYLYDEKGGGIVVDTRSVFQDDDREFKDITFKKGNVEFNVVFNNEDGTCLSIDWLKVDNGDGTYTKTLYDWLGNRTKRIVFKKTGGSKDICLKQTNY